MRYSVIIGFNVGLKAGAAWRGKVGTKVDSLDEVRFEPGEQPASSDLPKEADVEMLLKLGCLAPLEKEGDDE